MIPRTAELPRLEGKNLLRFYYFYLFNSKKNIFRFIIRDDYGMPDDKGTSKKPAVEKPKPKEPPKELPSIKKISLADSQGSHSDVELEWNSDSGHRDDEDSSTEEENTEDDYQIEEEEPTYAILLFYLFIYSYLLFYRAKGKEKVTQKGKGTQPTTGPQPGGYVLLRLSPKVEPQQPSPVMSPGEFFSLPSLSFVSPHPLSPPSSAKSEKPLRPRVGTGEQPKVRVFFLEEDMGQGKASKLDDFIVPEFFRSPPVAKGDEGLAVPHLYAPPPPPPNCMGC